MSAAPTRLLHLPAAAAVWAARTASRNKLLFSALAQVVLVVIGSIYLLFGALRTNPIAAQMTVRVHLEDSGGLLADQDVTLNGIPIGRVKAVEITADGVQAVAQIDGHIKIPRDGTTVRVSALSPAGEQYLDFQPTGAVGPLLTDGSVIDQSDTTTPVPLWRLLDNIEGLLAQTDPAQLEQVMGELGVSAEGPQKLRDLLAGGQMLISTLDGVLPQTVTLLRSSRPVFKIFDDSSAGLSRLADNLGGTLSGISAKDDGIRRLLDQTPRLLDTADGVIDENSATMVQLLGNLTTVAQLSYVRVPALAHLFRDDRPSVLDGVASLMHDGGIWAIADIYPRYFCDYPHPRDVPFIPNYPEPYMYTYCLNDDPGVLVRGARNAPAPADGIDTAGPPPGLDTLQRTDPTPSGPYTIDLPYGGPPMPPESEPQRQGGPY
ncbi:MlaD family protein [Mycolicibacillus trivialis]|nr:MlaD family protein [Mycolicibacillus trivialis]